MKKLALLLVLGMAVPAMAAVTFTADGDGSLKIYYTADPGDNPRAILRAVRAARPVAGLPSAWTED